jgi:uncharacterized protein YbjT (DUF2867 family)
MITAAARKIGRGLVSHLLSLPSKPYVVLPTSDAAKLLSLLPEALNMTRVQIVKGNIKDPRFVKATLKDHKVTGVSLALTGDDEQ